MTPRWLQGENCVLWAKCFLLEAINEVKNLGVWDLYEHDIFFSLVKDGFSNPKGKVEQAWTLEGEQVQIDILALVV